MFMNLMHLLPKYLGYTISLSLLVFFGLFSQNTCFAQPNNNACAYACMDWTLGSAQMKKAEQDFKSRTGKDVHFGVGTFMGEGDAIGTDKHLGACFRLVFTEGQKDIIAQALNTGYDMNHPNQFDIQMGVGGMGAFNACVGDIGISMFPGAKSPWGLTYGGVQNVMDCKNVPEYPSIESAHNKSNSLKKLCEYGFKHRYRGENGENYKFKFVPERVQCPEELTKLSGFKRNDDPSTYELQLYKPCTLGDKNSIACAMTRMMDCAKPTAAWKENVKNLNISGPSQACLRDGYTRHTNPNAPSATSSQCTSQTKQSDYCKDHPEAVVGFCSWNGGDSSGDDYCNANSDRCLSCGGGSWCTCIHGVLKGCGN